MPLVNDGDIVRALGYVTLYSAYVEEAIDDCVEVLLAADPAVDVRIRRQPASEKIRYCGRQLESYGEIPTELRYLLGALEHIRRLLERRHDVVHGRIYGGVPGQGDVRRSGRQGIPDRQVTSEELYALANDLFEAQAPLQHASMFRLPRFIARGRGANAP